MADISTLAGHLAQTGYLTKHGEVLCTVGLTYLLEDRISRRAFEALLERTAGPVLPGPLSWIAEAQQADKGRPDLEGRTVDEVAVVKVEAKITAALQSDQLASYASALAAPSTAGGSGGLLVVLVPEARRREADAVVEQLHARPGSASERPGAVVITWDEVLDVLAVTTDLNVAADVAQLRGMCTTLGALDIAPFEEGDLGAAWRERRTDFEAIVARATEALTGPIERILPLGLHDGYHRRYVCPESGASSLCYSVGVREPLPATSTPVVMRYHRDTGAFAGAVERLEASPFRSRLHRDQGDGHLWIPLEVPCGVGGARVVLDICDQARRIDAVARGDSLADRAAHRVPR